MALDYKSLRKLGGSEYGNIVVDPNATFEAGTIMAYTSTGTATVCSSASYPCGVAKWNKTSSIYGVSVNEAVTFDSISSTENLKHSNVSNVKVIDSDGTTDRTASVTVNAVNGTLTNTGSASGIAAGETVTVTYTYLKTEAEMQQSGKNFLNTMDDTQGSNRIVLLQGGWRIYTDKFDTTQTYAVNDLLYVAADGSGKFTKATTSGKKVGRVVDVPTATSPYLGVEGNFSVANNL